MPYFCAIQLMMYEIEITRTRRNIKLTNLSIQIQTVKT